jgi:acetoin utilization deacetylase AcuC-like enzyme
MIPALQQDLVMLMAVAGGGMLRQVAHPASFRPCKRTALFSSRLSHGHGHGHGHAYVSAASRLGLDPLENQRHCPLVYHEDYSFADWPSSHTFPMDKFERLAHVLLTNPDVHMQDDKPLVLHQDDFYRPLDYNSVNLPLLQSWLCGPLQSSFVNRFLQGQLTDQEARYIGFRELTRRPELIRRTVLEVAGTVLTAQLACHYGVAANLAGGTHHAHATMGAGYTIFNDLVVAAYWLTQSSQLQLQEQEQVQVLPFHIHRVLVIDCDVHQGDGTARCMREVPQLHDKLFTLSLHCASNYPHPKAQSTYDVALPDKITDAAYLDTMKQAVQHAVDQIQPDLVLYDAGVDIYQHDKLGRLHVSQEGIRQRDAWILDYCVQMEIPIAAVIGGGYDNNVHALARRHAILHQECSKVWRDHKLWNKIRNGVNDNNK